MQEYRFSMEKVLDWREDLEDVAQLMVKEKIEKVKNENDKLNRIISESRKLKSEQLFHSTIDHLKRHHLYRDLIDEKIIRQRLTVQKADKELEQARIELQVAHKDKKVMQKLEEKERTRHQDTVKKQEQTQLDEISTLSFGRPSIY
ncbi:flagellar export protein FliJ [Alkalibacterium sp. f15]|uniref:flagellar export protein FliJ n=1 Tax=Alkalibacterium sp. f15 TaxID=3414029 RepID=UPI003BF8E0B7